MQLTHDEDWVVSVVDQIPMPWPGVDELVGLGVPEEIAGAWQTLRDLMDPKVLRLVVEQRRN